jgi:PAS domain S-box-containing protein
LKKAEVLGKHTLDLFPEYNNEHWLSVFNSVLKDGKSLHYPIIEFQHMKGFGESWVMPLRNIKQQIIGLLSITSIITETIEMTRTLEQKNKELEDIIRELHQTAVTLKESEERYHRMITEVKDYAILFLSEDGTIENWNEGAEKINGYKANEIIGKNFSLFYTEQERQEHIPEKLLAEAKQYEKAHTEGWRVRKDGSLFWASTVITSVHDEKNNITGFSKVTHDLTDKKHASDKIIEANKELEQKNAELYKANKELESFNYISSHDLQEPLRQIQNFASRIMDVEQQNLSDKGKIYFERMNNSANRMQTLISDLLTYSRTTTAERKFENTDLNIIINQIKSELKETIDEKHATIEVGEMCEANIIPFQFRQLMHNLVGNSLKFSAPDVTPHIKIYSCKITSRNAKDVNLPPEKEYIQISITDNGIGFDPQYKDRIFEVFQRLHDRQKIPGTGIGLAIVKKIVENHNGFITTTSALNEGATFDIYIPASQNN